MSFTLGEAAYVAYANAGDWKTFDGRRMPTWKELSETDAGLETQRRWEVAAAVIKSLTSAEG